MQSRPFLVAVAAFVIVLIGGAAIAGIGAPQRTTFSAGATVDDKESTTSTAVDKPVTTTTKVDKPDQAKDEPKEEPREEPKEEPKPEAKTETKTVFTITRPSDGDHVASKVVTFGGEISDGYKVIRGKYTAETHEGTWAMELVLSPGKNRVGFEAVGEEGDTLYAKVTVYYDAPADEKPSDDVKTEFSAHQKYGSCGETVPYDKFYGTAAPGTTILVISEYGSGETKADANGKWFLRVDFPTSPAGKTFGVKVKASTGEKAYFEFTNTQADKDH